MIANRKIPDQNPKISKLKIFKISKIENRKSQNRKSKIFKISKKKKSQDFFDDKKILRKKNFLRFFSQILIFFDFGNFAILKILRFFEIFQFRIFDFPLWLQ